jgi:hypothetical protein
LAFARKRLSTELIHEETSGSQCRRKLMNAASFSSAPFHSPN